MISQDFADKDAVVLGITFSATEDLKEMARRRVAGDLLCDTDKSVAMAYGAAGPPTGKAVTWVS